MHPAEIKALIEKAGSSQTAIARSLTGPKGHPMSVATVGAVINGRGKSQRVAAAISQLVGVPVERLWPGHYPSNAVNAPATPRQRLSNQPPEDPMPIHAQDFPACVVADDLTITHEGRRYSVADFQLSHPAGKKVPALSAGETVRVETLDPAQFPGCVYVYADPAGLLCGYPLGLALPLRAPDDEPATSLAPATYQVPAHEPLPVGWARDANGRAVDLVGFIRESVAIMVRCDMAGTHDWQMQLAAAAASFLVLADSLAPATAPYLRALCWPDDQDGEQEDPAPSRRGVQLTRVSVNAAGTFEFNGLIYGCMQAAGTEVYIEPAQPSESHAVHIWKTEPDPATEEALLIGIAWPLPAVPTSDVEHV